MTKIWKLGCGNEVKGEGYILNLILYSFFRVFPIFDPMVPLHFSLAARIYKSKRLRVYTIVVFSFIRTFAPSF